MANVLVQESSLSAIADSIRAKNGTTDTYTPSEMSVAIDDLPSGGGTLITKSISANGTYNASSDNADGYSSVTVTVTPVLTTKSITENGTYTASSDSADGYSSVTVNVSGSGDYTADDWLDSTKPVGAVASNSSTAGGANKLYGRSQITSISLPNATTLGTNFAWYCSNLSSVYLPKVTKIGGSSLRSCKFSTLVLPSLTTVDGQFPFHNNTYLTAVDFGGTAAAQLKQYYMSNDSLNWTILVLRSTTMWTLSGTNAFQYSRFYKTTVGASATGRGGTIYVPSALLSTYQANSAWAALLSENTNNQMKTIESTHTDPDAPIDLTLYYVDGTPIPTS